MTSFYLSPISWTKKSREGGSHDPFNWFVDRIGRHDARQLFRKIGNAYNESFFVMLSEPYTERPVRLIIRDSMFALEFSLVHSNLILLKQNVRNPDSAELEQHIINGYCIDEGIV